MLHLLAFPPRHRLLEQVLDLLDTDDDVVLLGAGCRLARDGDALRRLVQAVSPQQVHMLDGGPDGPCPGLDAAGLVTLSERHQCAMSWYPEAG